MLEFLLGFLFGYIIIYTAATISALLVEEEEK